MQSVFGPNRFGSCAACLVFVLVNFASLSAAREIASPSISNIEPPSWWTNHTIHPVRLLLRGQNLSGARINAPRGLKPSEIVINSSGTYLFVSLDISPDLKPGLYPLTVETDQGRATISFALERPLDAKTNFQGINDDDVIYLIMVDRFSNGDQSNDTPSGAPAEATNRQNSRAYHGGDLRGIISHLPYLKELGVTAVWLTPWYDNWNGVNNCDKVWCPSAYYHGYHAIDYYKVEDRFGDMATLCELVQKAHSLGIKVIQDQVANHVGTHHPWLTDPPRNDWFHGSLQKHELNKFQNSVLLSPHANPDEVRNTLEGWFNEDLPDMNQDQPEVAQYEIQNSLWWVGSTGIDGIRQDTIQYVPRKFIRSLSESLTRQYARMWMVGEVFDFDAAQTSFFIGGHTGWDGIDTRLSSVFDFPLWRASRLAFTDKLPVRAIRDQLKYDALYPDAKNITTMVSNHDTARFMSLPGATVEGAMMHMAFTLTTRGIPQLYYGEEIAMEGGEDPDNRRDFPGGFPGDSRNAFEPKGRTASEQKMFDWTQRWLRLRREHSSIRRGRLIDLLYDDDSYIFARQDQSETVIIAINRSGQVKEVQWPVTSIGVKEKITLTPLMNTGGATVGNEQISMKLPPRTVVAYSVAR